jgi:hypothetical protein
VANCFLCYTCLASFQDVASTCQCTPTLSCLCKGPCTRQLKLHAHSHHAQDCELKYYDIPLRRWSLPPLPPALAATLACVDIECNSLDSFNALASCSQLTKLTAGIQSL